MQIPLLAVCLFSLFAVPAFAQSDELRFVISSGKVDGYAIDKDEKSLVLEITPEGEGNITIVMPRSLIDAKDESRDGQFRVLVGNLEDNWWSLSEFDGSKIEGFRVLTMPFASNVTEIIIVGTQVSDSPKNQKSIPWIRQVLVSNDLVAEKESPYKYYAVPMPKHWESEFSFVIDDAIEFWSIKSPEHKLVQVFKPTDADLIIEWGSVNDEFQGYFRCGYEDGRCKILVNLGYFDSNDWSLASKEYANVVMKHEIGHFLGYDHSTDPNDIMYPAIERYDRWLELKDTQIQDAGPAQTGLSPAGKIPSLIRDFTDEWLEDENNVSFIDGIHLLQKEGIIHLPKSENGSHSDVKEPPIWFRNIAGWWIEGKIDDYTFAQGIQYMVNNGIIKVRL